jgi:hypothetical protein
VTRTGPQAIAWAETHHVGWGGECLGFTRTSFDLPLVYARAIDAWHATVTNHPTTNPNSIPAGVPVFMQGANPAGHVALSLGGGRFYSTNDAAGGPGPYSIQSWMNVGYQLLGWAEDLNNTYVYGTRFGQSTTAPTPTTQEDDDMKLKHTSTAQTQATKAGVWKNLRINDGALVSILTSPRTFDSQVQVRVKGLPAGKALQARFVVYDDAKKKVTRSFPITEIVATTGDAFGSLSQIGRIEDGERLRVHFTGPDGVTVTSAAARTLYSA